MKGRRLRILVIIGVALVNAAMWIIPSDVMELVARDRQTLLGRYSRTHFAWIIALVPLSAAALYLTMATTRAAGRRRAFRVAAVTLAIALPLLVLDVVLRLSVPYYYVFDQPAYRRTPHWSNKDEHPVFEDRPDAIRTYPRLMPGFGEVPAVITTDLRGYRNLQDMERCDVVALGDSFTEGSKVNDDQAWPVSLAAQAGMKVCNLGMSGYAPQHCLAALRSFGLDLKPTCAIYLLYEGNDFKSAKMIAKTPSLAGKIFKTSRVLEAFDAFLVRTLGPIGAHHDFEGMEILSWLPVAVPTADGATYYAFPPSFLTAHSVSREEFEDGGEWRNTRHNLEQMLELCRRHGIAFVLLYAPTKPRVVLPMIWDALPAEKVHAFANLKSSKDLPGADEFLQNLRACLDVKEEVTAAWCAEHDVPLVSLIEPMRTAMLRGRQPYYSYDEHWTPVGHEIAARAVAESGVAAILRPKK